MIFFYQILHIKCAIYIGLSADLGVPLKDRGCAPQPFTKGSGSQKNKDGTPPTLHDLDGAPKGQGLDPPTLHDLEWLPKRTRMEPPQPFTIWTAPQKDKDAR